MKGRCFNLLLCLTGLLFIAAAARRAPWPGPAFTEVRAYFYNLEDEAFAKVITNGHLSGSVVNTNGAVLSKEQTQRLLASLQRPAPAKDAFTNCYIPHHAFVFYDKARKPVAWIELCFYCGGADVSPALAASQADFDQRPSVEIMRELALPVSAADYAKARSQRRKP